MSISELQLQTVQQITESMKQSN